MKNKLIQWILEGILLSIKEKKWNLRSKLAYWKAKKEINEMFNMNGSWRTTGGGIALALSAIATALTALTDNNPATNVDWVSVGGQIAAAWALIQARDNKVSSEQAGLK